LVLRAFGGTDTQYLQKLDARTLCCCPRRRTKATAALDRRRLRSIRRVDATPCPPDHDGSPSGRTVNNLDAGTQHRAVGDSTEPRYGALAGAVKPTPPLRWRAAAAAITARRRSAGSSWWTIAGPRSPSLAGGPAQPGHDTPKRHARPDKKCAARCGQPLAARPTALVASPVVGRLPHPSRARSAGPCPGREYS
jgi:hypothetical protein